MGQGLCSLVTGVFPRANVRGTFTSIATVWVSPARGDCSTHEGSVTPFLLNGWSA